MRLLHITTTILLASLFWVGCQNQTQPPQEQESQAAENQSADTYGASPIWAQNANIYEVNIRQYSEEGTFKAFGTNLERLDEMGVDILWFMPIFPISEANRKGSLGSYYAVSSFRQVNPEFGTEEEFQAVIDKAHELGMKVILDWVPNHTGWDHEWITSHPEYYTQDANGNIVDPINPETGESWGWTDVADLNYDNEEMRQNMIDDMVYWLREAGIDGFRMDVAHGVPVDFWEDCVAQLREVDSDVFMLAEAEVDELLNKELFAMDYGWTFHHLLNHAAQGEANADSLFAWYEADKQDVQHGYHMHFTTNHDENSWNGTIEERMGSAGDAMAVIAFTFDGMPLIYSGQEAGMNKRLEFFEKDLIDWGDYEKEDFFTTLLTLKHENEALWNGEMGAPVERLDPKNDNVMAYSREKGYDQVVVVVNLSGEPQEVDMISSTISGEYRNVFTPSEPLAAKEMLNVSLEPWGYRVYERH